MQRLDEHERHIWPQQRERQRGRPRPGADVDRACALRHERAFLQHDCICEQHLAELLGRARRGQIDARIPARDELRESGRREGERQKTEIVGQAQEQRERIVSDTQTQIDAQAQAAVAGIRDDVVVLALTAAEKVTKKSLSDDDHRRLVEEALADADLSGLQKA